MRKNCIAAQNDTTSRTVDVGEDVRRLDRPDVTVTTYQCRGSGRACAASAAATSAPTRGRTGRNEHRRVYSARPEAKDAVFARAPKLQPSENFSRNSGVIGQQCCLIEVKDSFAVFRFGYGALWRNPFLSDCSFSCKLSGRLRAVCEATPRNRTASDLCPESARSLFRTTQCGRSENTVPKPKHITCLERRQRSIEIEIGNALLHCSTDDPMVADLRRRMFHLRDELDRLRQQAVRDRRLH